MSRSRCAGLRLWSGRPTRSALAASAACSGVRIWSIGGDHRAERHAEHRVEHAGATALSSLSVVTNANRLRGFTAAGLPQDFLIPAAEPVVEIGRDEMKEKVRPDQAPIYWLVCSSATFLSRTSVLRIAF